MVADLVNDFKKSDNVAVVLCDPSKGFDCIPRDILLQQLEKYSFRVDALDFRLIFCEQITMCFGY